MRMRVAAKRQALWISAGELSGLELLGGKALVYCTLILSKQRGQ
jgi:hypothetical protein